MEQNHDESKHSSFSPENNNNSYNEAEAAKNAIQSGIDHYGMTVDRAKKVFGHYFPRHTIQPGFFTDNHDNNNYTE